MVRLVERERRRLDLSSSTYNARTSSGSPARGAMIRCSRAPAPPAGFTSAANSSAGMFVVSAVLLAIEMSFLQRGHDARDRVLSCRHVLVPKTVQPGPVVPAGQP